jgi:hypothetical protein
VVRPRQPGEPGILHRWPMLTVSSAPPAVGEQVGVHRVGVEPAHQPGGQAPCARMGWLAHGTQVVRPHLAVPEPAEPRDRPGPGVRISRRTIGGHRIQDKIRRVMFVVIRSISSSPRPESTVRVAYKVKPLICSNVMVGGMDSSWRAVITSTSAAPSWSNAVLRGFGKVVWRSARVPAASQCMTHSSGAGPL